MLRNITQLNLLELESRIVPSWWNITAPTPAEGSIGSTDAHHIGGLVFNSDYTPENGIVKVYADTATEAVAKALEGTLTVIYNDEIVDYPFGPDTIGTSPTDHKPFLVTDNSGTLTIDFEDLAGFANSDWDYNDRTWSGISSSSSKAPVLYEGTAIFTGPYGDVVVTATITAENDDTMRWNYHLYNSSYVYYNYEYNYTRGVGHFCSGS